MYRLFQVFRKRINCFSDLTICFNLVGWSKFSKIITKYRSTRLVISCQFAALDNVWVWAHNDCETEKLINYVSRVQHYIYTSFNYCVNAKVNYPSVHQQSSHELTPHSCLKSVVVYRPKDVGFTNEKDVIHSASWKRFNSTSIDREDVCDTSHVRLNSTCLCDVMIRRHSRL